MSYLFLDKAEDRTIYELSLLVKFVVSKTLHESESEIRTIGKKAFKCGEMLEANKRMAENGAVAYLSDEQKKYFRKFLQLIPSQIFDDATEREKLLSTMRQAKCRSLGKKSFSIHVSAPTSKRLNHLLKNKNFHTPQEGINFLLDFYIKTIKNRKLIASKKSLNQKG